MSSAVAKQSCSSTWLRSFGPMPACSYASLAALRVTVFTSNIVGLRSCQGSEVRAEAATQTGFVVCWRAFSADMRTGGAAASPVGQHIRSVLGQAIILAFITSSSGVSFWYWAYGLWTECLWFLTDILAKCSIFVPYLRMCSTPR